MTPEAQNPNASPEQTGSADFKEGLHPTDRVRPFKQGELSEVSEVLIGQDGSNIPNDVSAIDRHKLDVDFNKVPLSPVETKTRIGRKGIAGVVVGLIAAAGVAGFGVAKATGGGSPEDRDSTTSSTSAEPTEKGPTKSGEKSKGVNLIVGVETIPSAEQVAYAAENPILVKGGVPTAEGAMAAYELMGEYENIYTHSGTLSNSPSEASLAAGEAIKENIYGPPQLRQANTVDFENLARERELIGGNLASYPGRLQSYGHWEAGNLDQVEELKIGNQTVWKMPFTEYNEGNWDIVGETPERKNIMTGTVMVSTYETVDGKLAWYHYDGIMDSMTVISDAEAPSS